MSEYDELSENNGKPTIDAEKTRELQKLRLEHIPKVTIQEMAQYFEMNRDSVRAWELGKSIPIEELRREQFVDYLWNKLGLRSNLGRLHRVWNSIMVDEWKWALLTNDELKKHLTSVDDDGLNAPALRPRGSAHQIDERYIDYFYHYRKGIAPSIRLCGAADELFPPKTVHIIPETTPYELPDDLLVIREEVIDRLTKRAVQRNAMFFNGPNTRLMDFRVTPRDETEQKHLELTVGPIDWHDYSVGKFKLGEVVKQRTIDEVKHYMDLDEIAFSRIVRNNKLGNILCTISTIITVDGFALYTQRGSNVSAEPYRLTGAIAENIQRSFDRSLEKPNPDDLPAPFRTVIRGIEEEASPRLADYVRKHPQSLFLLGLDFDLLSFAPDLLFMIFLPLPFSEILYLCRQHPGKDFIEGHMQAVSLNDTEHLDALLTGGNWIPGGKASFIRTLEFLDSAKHIFSGGEIGDICRKLERFNK